MNYSFGCDACGYQYLRLSLILFFELRINCKPTIKANSTFKL